MSDRRAARAATSSTGRAVYSGGGLPLELAHGPCLEDWTTANEGTQAQRAMLARPRWNAAVDGWATSSGWATESRPAMNPRNLARTRHPWSRGFLTARSEVPLVDYYEGRTDAHPGRDRHGWDIDSQPH